MALLRDPLEPVLFVNERTMQTERDAVAVRVPTRIDLAGGTLDIWPLYLFHPGSVTINAAVNLWAEVKATPLPRPGRILCGGDGRCVRAGGSKGFRIPGFELYDVVLEHLPLTGGLYLETSCRAPRGAGLGGSSSLFVALCAALVRLRGESLSRQGLLLLVRDLETRLLGIPAGTQDFYAALWGGVQTIRWEPGGPVRETIRIDPAELERRLLLVHTGKSRHSGANNWEVFKKHLDGDRKVRALFERIAAAARDMHEAFVSGDFEGVGCLMAEEARARQRLSPGIGTPEIRSLESTLARHGARAVKVCGAGGGGCVMVYARPEQKRDLVQAAARSGFSVLPFRIVQKGLQVRTAVPPRSCQRPDAPRGRYP